MSKSWILDVLTDLREFAAQNDMPIVAAELDDLVMVAMAEMASSPVPSMDVARDGTYGKAVGNLSGAPGASRQSG